MPRPLINNPLGVSLSPNPVKDPTRESEIAQEFVRKAQYAIKSFGVARLIENKFGTVEASVRRLKDARARVRGSKRTQKRLHPEVESAINTRARANARASTCKVDPAVTHGDAVMAADELACKLSVKQGRKDDRMLAHHVEGLMALWQETSGRPVTAQLRKGDEYVPQLPDPKARHIFDNLHAVDTSVTVTQVANIICAARKKYAGKPMHFADFFVGYGAKANADGNIELAGSYRLESIDPNFPIYCV
jgi:hypothetical protein